MVELLKELCSLRGVSGDEGPVREYILRQIEGHCETSVDALGNIIAFKKGAARAKNRVQLSAHMDEVGFIVTNAEEDGLLRFAAVGGMDPSVVVGKALLVGERGLPGVVGLKPIHLCDSDERDTIPKLDALTIDIGAKNREEALAAVQPGARAVFAGDLLSFGEGMLTARALDDRAGCALLIKLLQGDLPCDCHMTFTVQEENGCIGAKTAAYAVQPDVAVALETTTAGDIADAPEHKKVCRLGGGPVISFMDRGTVYSPELYAEAFSIAKENGVACQAKEGVYGGNESRSLQASRGGAKVLAVSLPCRYLHSPSCVLCQSDINQTLRLLPPFIERFAQR